MDRQITDSFVVGHKLIEALRDCGALTDEQVNRTAEIVIKARAGDAVTMTHTTYLRRSQVERIAAGIERTDDVNEART